MGIIELIMEGDALQVVNILKKSNTDWSLHGGLLITDVKNMLNSFARWSTQHIKRDRC